MACAVLTGPTNKLATTRLVISRGKTVFDESRLSTRLKAIPGREVKPVRTTITPAAHREALPVKLRHPQHFTLTHSETTDQCVEVGCEFKSEQKLDHKLH